MSFGTVMLAFFCSPLYFAMRKRWGALILNGILYVLALITLPVFGLGVLFWIIAFAHAMWDLRSVMLEKAMQRQAELIAQKMSQSR